MPPGRASALPGVLLSLAAACVVLARPGTDNPFHTPSLPHHELLRRGLAARPYVLPTASRMDPNHTVYTEFAVDTAFGELIAFDHVRDFVAAHTSHVPAHAAALVQQMAQHKLLRNIDYANLQLVMHYRLRQRQLRLGVTPENADVLLVGRGCEAAYQRYAEEERAAIAAGKRSTVARRIHALGSTWHLTKMEESPHLCAPPDVTLTYAVLDSHTAAIPYLRGVIPTAGLSPLNFTLQDKTLKHRHALLSFRGSISGSKVLSKHRHDFILAMERAAHTMRHMNLPPPITRLFWTPGVQHLRHQDEHEIHLGNFNHRAYKGDVDDIMTYITYASSYFCLQPTGAYERSAQETLGDEKSGR